MWRCPVCEKEQVQGLVCDDCGFDASCNYEQNQTLCSALPKHAEPISVRAAKWRQQKQTVVLAPGALVCPKCGGKNFSFLVDDVEFMCADCGAKMPVSLPAGMNAEEPPPAEPEEVQPPAEPEEPPPEEVPPPTDSQSAAQEEVPPPVDPPPIIIVDPLKGTPNIRKRKIAILCCLFPYAGWFFAAHCFYLKKKSRGILELVLFWAGVTFFSFGVPLILIWLFLWIQDIIRIWKMPKLIYLD